MKLIFKKGIPGRRCNILPRYDIPVVTLDGHERQGALHLPEVSEQDISRHYTELARATHGASDGFYPLGSCTMKYSPKINEETAPLPKFTRVHPLQPESSIQGCLEVLRMAETPLCEITGMDEMSFQPAAGAHGEFASLLLIKAYHENHGNRGRKKIIVPDSAHGTSPANAVMAEFGVVNIPSQEDGCVNLEKLRAAMRENTTGLVLTNSSTVGLFDKNILNITRIIHEAGGLNYYDGVNSNTVVDITRPDDMGFDVIHLDLHKTLSTPHGDGGPGSGPVGCKEFLAGFPPGKQVVKAENGGYHLEQKTPSVDMVKSFYGNFLVVVKALTYITMLGKQGVSEASHNAALNTNYIKIKLLLYYHMPYQETCMYEFVMSLGQEKHEVDISAMDIAEALLDYDIHPPAMYFPLTVHEALMVGPTEAGSRGNLDELIHAFVEIYKTARKDSEKVRIAPRFAMMGRLDEVAVARNPGLRYEFETECDC